MFDTLFTMIFGWRYVFWQMRTNVRAAIWIEEAEIALNKARMIRTEKRIVLLEDQISTATNAEAAELKKELEQTKQEYLMAEGDVAAKTAQVEKTKLKLAFLNQYR